MAAYNISDVSLTVFAALLIVSGASICDDNRGSRQLIGGDNSNAVNYFIQLLRGINTFDLMCDNIRHRGCRENIGQFRHQKGFYVNDKIWILDCWEPTECTLVEENGHVRKTLRLLPKSSFPFSSVGRIQVNTVLLPIDEHYTITYTFLPYVSQRSMFLVTSLLSGCSVFVATPDNANCNIIVMHANWACREETDDIHRQAMLVTKQVNSLNKQCIYQIQRRWAGDHLRDNIKRNNYPYNSNIIYYTFMIGHSFEYGYNLGGSYRKWTFCLKELDMSPRQERCNEIL